jgi:hypothetical protein
MTFEKTLKSPRRMSSPVPTFETWVPSRHCSPVSLSRSTKPLQWLDASGSVYSAKARVR